MAFDEQLRRAFATLTDRLHDDIRRQVQAAVDEALAGAPAQPSIDTAAGHALLDSVRWLGRARSLGETLDTLASCAAREGHRAAVLTRHGGRLHSWRFVGFGPLDQNPPADLFLEDAGIIARAVRDNEVTSGHEGPAFAELPQGASCIALPIALEGEVVAVLYADDESRALNADALEILARYAARGIEAMTAFRVARSLTAAASVPEAPVPSSTADDEEEAAAARRYARLLVSEIKLYHEDSVAAGRRDRDIGSRLGGEIARARVLYEQRVPPHVRQRARYFDDELVRTLANGDASLLEMTT